MITFSTNDRIIGRFNGSNFVEESLTLSGIDGIAVTKNATQFTISGNQAALTAAYQAADLALSGALTSAYQAADAALSGALQTDINSRVLRSGDTMTGFLTLNADPVNSGHAATKQYVDAQITSSAIAVDEEGVFVVSGTTLDFTHALDVTDGGGGLAIIAVDESEFTTVVFTSGDQNIGGNKTFDDNVVITGDLTVNGTTTTLNTEQLLVEDNIVTLNSTVTGTPTLDAGIEVERGTSTNAQVLFDETADYWVAGISGALEKIILTSDLATYVTESELLSASGDLTAAYIAADAALSGALTSAYQAADLALSGALTSAYQAADTALSGALTAAYQAADSALSGVLQADINSRVLRAGDTMTGFLTLFADPTASGHAANKYYVDAAISGSTSSLAIQEDASPVVANASTLNFTHALDVVSGVGTATVSVDESEFTSVVFLTGNQTISGTKSFASPVVLTSGTEPALISSTGTEGEVRWADDYLYVCVATNSWKRVALAQF